MHVRSVGQRLGLPPKTDGFLLLLLLLLQDEPSQVGLDLGVNTVSRYTASVGFGRRRDVFLFSASRTNLVQLLLLQRLGLVRQVFKLVFLLQPLLLPLDLCKNSQSSPLRAD